MNIRRVYLDKAKACADAADRAREPAERVALLRLSYCYVRLADYVATLQEHGRNVREKDPCRRAALSVGDADRWVRNETKVRNNATPFEP
jgi:hypothetical protein